jgi:hypothetical protein
LRPGDAPFGRERGSARSQMQEFAAVRFHDLLAPSKFHVIDLGCLRPSNENRDAASFGLFRRPPAPQSRDLRHVRINGSTIILSVLPRKGRPLLALHRPHATWPHVRTQRRHACNARARNTSASIAGPPRATARSSSAGTHVRRRVAAGRPRGHCDASRGERHVQWQLDARLGRHPRRPCRCGELACVNYFILPVR